MSRVHQSLGVLLMFIACTAINSQADPYMWLEKVESNKALNWVKQQNKKSLTHFSQATVFKPFKNKALELLNANDRIPTPMLYADQKGKQFVYNFWQDAQHIRGILRRTSLIDYQRKNPDWETVLDIDLLAKKEAEDWVFKGFVCRQPQLDRCMIQLSRGGKDAVVAREFDLDSKNFVKDGFYLKEAKSDLAWLDKDQLIVATDFGPNTLTNSGYPRIVKIWKRGQKLKQAKPLIEGLETDVGMWPSTLHTPQGRIILLTRSITFYTSEYFIYTKDQPIKLHLPADVEVVGIFQESLLIKLKSDWKPKQKVYTQGSLVAVNWQKMIQQNEVNLQLIAAPDQRTTIDRVIMAKEALYLLKLQNVKGQLVKLTRKNHKWKEQLIPLPDNGDLSIRGSSLFSKYVLVEFQSFLKPKTLYLIKPDTKVQEVKSYPAKFDSSRYKVEQHWVSSKDGTKVPYFLVGKKDLQFQGKTPTLLYGYGGFEVSVTPWYSAITGNLWLEQGGVYALANIRGGGEFGPSWHQAALKTKRQHAYDDFIAVAQDLIKRKITSPRHLGIQGGSNGGLLMGVMLTQRPDLFNAIVCQVPLLDMLRFHKLLAGASWMGEYGNPDIPEERDYLQSYSPYHNVRKDQEYPKVMFMTSTRDDRVHPGHARKMAHKMLDQKHEIYYYENIVGGHGGTTNNEQKALQYALIYSYLIERLK